MPAKTAGEIYDELRATKPKVDVDGEEYYLAEGDLLMDKNDLMRHAAHMAAEAKKEEVSSEDIPLVGIVDVGGWLSPRRLHLSTGFVPIF